MGGLGCALALAKKGFKDVTVYEHAPGLGFVGAGIQLAPNMARILDRLGCWKGIYASATNVKETSIRRELGRLAGPPSPPPSFPETASMLSPGASRRRLTRVLSLHRG